MSAAEDSNPIPSPEADIPAEVPTGPASAEPEVADAPMGVPADADPAAAPLPGLPEHDPQDG